MPHHGEQPGCPPLSADYYILGNPRYQYLNNVAYNPGTGGGALLNAAMNYVADLEDGGLIYFDDPIIVDDMNALTPAVNSDIIIKARGRRIFAATLAAARQSRSYIEFQGTYRWTNNLGAMNRGRLILRDMGVIFNSCINGTPMLDIDNVPIMTENCFFYEEGNTVVDHRDAVIGNTAAAPTPDGHWCSFKDTYVYLKSANAYAYGLHAEMARWAGCEIGFSNDDQRGISVKGVTPYHVDSLYYWLGDPAQGCKVFELFSQEKEIVINTLDGSTQAGAGLTTPNIVFGRLAGGTWTNEDPSYIVHGSIQGSIVWGITPAAPIHLWEDAQSQMRTSLSSGCNFQDTFIRPPQKTFICDSTPETAVNPGASPGAVFNLALEDEVDLRYVCHARVSARAQGDQALGNKGVVIYDVSTGAILCDTGTWAGAAVTYITGPWTNVTVNALRNCNVYGYTDLGVETMSCWKVTLETR